MTLSAIEGVLTLEQIKATLEEAGLKKQNAFNIYKWESEKMYAEIKFSYKNRRGREYFVNVIDFRNAPPPVLTVCHDLASLRKAVGL